MIIEYEDYSLIDDDKAFIKIEQPLNKYFVPASIIYRFAKEHNMREYESHFGESIIVLCGKKYKYLSYSIEPKNDNTEIVTIFLEKYLR